MQLSNSATTSDPSLAALLLPAPNAAAITAVDATVPSAPFADVLGAVATATETAISTPAPNGDPAATTATPLSGWPFRALRRMTAETPDADLTPATKTSNREKSQSATDTTPAPGVELASILPPVIPTAAEDVA